MVRYDHRLLRTYLREALGAMTTFVPVNAATRNNVDSLDAYGQPTSLVRRGGSLLADEAEEQQQMMQDTQCAACCLVFGDHGTVLAVSRKDDPTAFGLPGGKVDPGETPEQAAARELMEETGLCAVSLRQVFIRRDAGGYVTYTFVCKVTGDLSTVETGVVRWVKPQVLFDGPFGEYNRKLWTQLNIPTR